MNYGFNSQCDGWQEDKKEILASELGFLLNKLKLSEPYIEIDNLYDGVRVRKITNLTEKQHDKLITESEKIYVQVMGIK